MFCDFEGKTEEEARSKAIETLNLEDGNFDVEILENSKKGFFKKAYVKIRVYYGEEENLSVETDSVMEESNNVNTESYIPNSDLENKVIDFVDNLIIKMGYEGKTSIAFRSENKIGLNIDSIDSSILIGRKGKNLDALQLIANVYAGNIDSNVKIVLDSENYRMRHEESIVRNAYKTAEQVKRSGKSRLLDPMNPFERRLVHTALNDFDGVDTKSEGEGLYKQVRIIPTRK